MCAVSTLRAGSSRLEAFGVSTRRVEVPVHTRRGGAKLSNPVAYRLRVPTRTPDRFVGDFCVRTPAVPPPSQLDWYGRGRSEAFLFASDVQMDDTESQNEANRLRGRDGEQTSPNEEHTWVTSWSRSQTRRLREGALEAQPTEDAGPEGASRRAPRRVASRKDLRRLRRVGNVARVSAAIAREGLSFA